MHPRFLRAEPGVHAAISRPARRLPARGECARPAPRPLRGDERNCPHLHWPGRSDRLDRLLDQMEERRMTSPQAQAPAFSTAVKAVLFDLDGTLIDSAPDIAGAVNQLVAAHQLPGPWGADVPGIIGNALHKTLQR